MGLSMVERSLARNCHFANSPRVADVVLGQSRRVRAGFREDFADGAKFLPRGVSAFCRPLSPICLNLSDLYPRKLWHGVCFSVLPAT